MERAFQSDQRAPAAPPTSTLTAPPTFTQASLPATFTKPGPNAAQGLPAVLFAGGSRSRGCGVIQFRTVGRIGQDR
jgi:hypothetical protein